MPKVTSKDLTVGLRLCLMIDRCREVRRLGRQCTWCGTVTGVDKSAKTWTFKYDDTPNTFTYTFDDVTAFSHPANLIPLPYVNAT